MLKKIAGLCLVLIIATAGAAQAQKTLNINGVIQNLKPTVFGDKSAIMLFLKGRPEIFVVKTADGPKFGLLTPATAAKPDEGKMATELNQAKGWKVRLTVEPPRDPQSKEYRVTALERLPEKK